MAKVISVLLVAVVLLAIAYYFYGQRTDPAPAVESATNAVTDAALTTAPTLTAPAPRSEPPPVLQTTPTMSRAEAETVLAGIPAELESAEARVKSATGATTAAEFAEIAQSEAEPIFRKYLEARAALEAEPAAN